MFLVLPARGEFSLYMNGNQVTLDNAMAIYHGTATLDQLVVNGLRCQVQYEQHSHRNHLEKRMKRSVSPKGACYSNYLRYTFYDPTNPPFNRKDIPLLTSAATMILSILILSIYQRQDQDPNELKSVVCTNMSTSNELINCIASCTYIISIATGILSTFVNRE